MRKWKWVIAPVLVAALAGQARADDEVERVRAVLQQHPEIILEAIKAQGPAVLDVIETAARARQKEKERERFAIELANPLTPKIEAGRATLGPKDAPVTIVEYSDFLCHFCAQAASTVKKLTQEHPKDVRLVYKHFATGKNDVRAALYFEAINLQDPKKAWTFMDKVFSRQKDVAQQGDAVLTSIAKEVGVDMPRLTKDLQRKDLADRIAADVKEAREFGFTGTPIFLINGAPVRGAVPYEVLEEFVSVAKNPKAAAVTDGKS